MASTSFAASYGSAGCGLGSVIFKDQPGIMQILAATTNGTFGNGISTTGPFPFQFLRAGHFNGDSQPDIAYLRNATNVAVMLGIEGGTFQEPRNYSVTVNATSLPCGDFTGVGRECVPRQRRHCRRRLVCGSAGSDARGTCGAHVAAR